MSKMRKIKWKAPKISRKDVTSMFVRNRQAWFTTAWGCSVRILCCAAIDGGGFWSIASKLGTQTGDRPHTSVIILSVAGLAAAFEVAPLYMGYALCLKFHNLGERIRNYVLGFSMAAFLLGVQVNFYFRFLTFFDQFLPDIVACVERAGFWERLHAMPLSELFEKVCLKLVQIYTNLGSAKGYEEGTAKLVVSFTETVTFSLIPVITSLINLTIGCLAFDPLYADVARLSKKLAKLRARKCWWEAKEKEKKQASNDDSGKNDYLGKCIELRQATERTRFEMQQAYVHIVVDGMAQKEIECRGESFWWKIFKK